MPPYNAHPFWVTVKAVYNKDSSKSIATDSIYFGGIMTGINGHNSKEYFSISPNPFSMQTVLQTDNLLKSAIITIFNCFGQTVKQIKNISGQTITVQRDNLQSGLYFLRLTQDNKTIATDKLIIIDN